MRSQTGFTDAQAVGRLNGMPNAELGTILGPGLDGSLYVVRAVTGDGVCLIGRASAQDVIPAMTQVRSMSEATKWEDVSDGLRRLCWPQGPFRPVVK